MSNGKILELFHAALVLSVVGDDMEPHRCLATGLVAVASLTAAAAPDSDWQSLRAVKPGAQLHILTRDGASVKVRFASSTEESVEIIAGSTLRSLPMS